MGNLKYWTFCTTDLPRTELQLDPGPSDEGPATNSLSHGIANGAYIELNFM